MPNIQTILIVDDDELVRAVISKVAERRGYESVLAHNGKEAVEILEKSFAFGAIFLDLLMPVSSGWEVLAVIKDNPKTRDVPVVIVSGVPISDHEKAQLSEKVTAFVDKESFSLAEFEKLLEDILPQA